MMKGREREESCALVDLTDPFLVALSPGIFGHPKTRVDPGRSVRPHPRTGGFKRAEGRFERRVATVEPINGIDGIVEGN